MLDGGNQIPCFSFPVRKNCLGGFTEARLVFLAVSRVDDVRIHAENRRVHVLRKMLVTRIEHERSSTPSRAPCVEIDVSDLLALVQGWDQLNGRGSGSAVDVSSTLEIARIVRLDTHPMTATRLFLTSISSLQADVCKTGPANDFRPEKSGTNRRLASCRVPQRARLLRSSHFLACLECRRNRQSCKQSKYRK